jgi:UDP-N-acetylmuramoyl-tripeptide--D-alanyl-D-alanine ligase
MEPLLLSEIVNAVNGRLINCSDDFIIDNLSTKLTSVRKGYLFIPLKNVNSCESIMQANKKGAVAAVVTKEINCAIPQIIVKNTGAALTNLTKYYRSKFDIPVIAVTGSCGKTSTKGMIASVLSEQHPIHKTFENQNNVMGVIRTSLALRNSHNAVVYELGFPGKIGYIKGMTNITRPSIGVITNISTAHTKHLKNKDDVFKAKMEITTYFDENSILIINSDDKYLSTIKEKNYRIIKISTQGNGDYNAKDITNLVENGVEFKCNYKGEEHLFRINVPGVHNVYNALTAIAISDLLDIDVEKVKSGISKFRPEKLRMTLISTNNNVKIILDCYNANLESMKAGIDTLKPFKGNRRIAVLGDILELGPFTKETHREIGNYISDKCDILVSVGKFSKYIYEMAQKHGESKHFRTKKQASRYLKNIVKENDVLLIKGSRGMTMEQIANYLVKTFNS